MATAWKKRAQPGHPAFRLADYPFFLMNQAAGRYNAAIAQSLSQIGVDQPVWRVLMILDERDRASIGDIAETAVMKRSTITRVIQRMSDQGLVSTRADDHDGRVIRVRLTRSGLAALDKVKSVAAQVFARATQGIHNVEIRALNLTLAKVAQNLSKPPYA